MRIRRESTKPTLCGHKAKRSHNASAIGATRGGWRVFSTFLRTPRPQVCIRPQAKNRAPRPSNKGENAKKKEFTRRSHKAAIPHSARAKDVTRGGYRAFSTYIRTPRPQHLRPQAGKGCTKLVRASMGYTRKRKKNFAFHFFRSDHSRQPFQSEDAEGPLAGDSA